MPSRPGAKPKAKSDIIKKVSGGKGAGSGPPSYELIEAQRQVFETCMTYGVPVDRLVEAFGLGSIQTFYDILNRDENLYQRIERGRAIANAKVAQTLYEKATKEKDTSAMIWWEKTRSRMRDRDLTASEVRDWVLNLPYNMREKFFSDLGVDPTALHGTGLVIDASPGTSMPVISVNFVESPHRQEADLASGNSPSNGSDSKPG